MMEVPAAAVIKGLSREGVLGIVYLIAEAGSGGQLARC